MKHFFGFLRDQPFWADLGLFMLVATHFAMTTLGYLPNVWAAIADPSNQQAAQTLYLAWLQPAATVAGFAGVVVVFGLTASSDRFKTFRANAGRSLRRTWVSSSLSGFEAVALAVAAPMVSIAGLLNVAPFLFELALLLFLHGALRLIWILSGLIGIVGADDIKATGEKQPYPLDRLPYKNGVDRRAG